MSAASKFTGSKWLGQALFSAAVLGLAYYAVARLALAVAQETSDAAVMWPASGLVLAALLIEPKRYHALCLGAAALASFAANIGSDGTLLLSLGFTFANITEPLVALWLLRRLGMPEPRFDDIGYLGGFTLAAVVASLWSAGLATLFAQSGAMFALSWFMTVFMGIVFVTPILITMALLLRVEDTSVTIHRSIWEVGAWFSLVGAVTIAVFWQNAYPILFLPPVAVLAATYRLDSFGAAASVLIVAVVATILTGQGSGPVQFVPGGTHAIIIFLQFYLLVQLACALPLAAILAARTRLSRELVEKNRLLNQAEAAAQVGHWRTDLAKGKLFWSDEVYRIHGRKTEHPPALMDGLNSYIPADRLRVSNLLDNVIRSGEPFEFEASIVRPDGTIRHVVSRGEAEIDENGRTVAVFGSVQDITAQVESARKLEEARAEAEKAAQYALQLANTDTLTGLPNRRFSMNALDLAVEDAAETGKALSIAMFDIDHFKSVNDRYGHARGDAVLCAVARSAVAAGRAEDLIGRIGGEEFLMVLPGADSQEAMRTAERVRAAIERDTRLDGNGCEVTVSIGVATLSGKQSGEMLLKVADDALYEAKADGRNLIRLFG